MLTELRRERSRECISDLVLDEWAAGELTAEEITRLEAHVATCDACAARKRELAATAEQFLRAAPVPPVRTTVGKKEEGARGRRWLAGASAVLAMAAAVALYARGTADVGDTRTKGGPHVGFFVKRGDVVTEGTEGQRVRAGDQLRFVVTSDAPRHLAILSLDSRGAVSVFSPSLTETVAVGAVNAEPLPGGVQLDDSPGRERIFALFCDAPLSVEPVASALREKRRVDAPPGCSVQEFELVKDAP